jgi:hypothetical protein
MNPRVPGGIDEVAPLEGAVFLRIGISRGRSDVEPSDGLELW